MSDYIDTREGFKEVDPESVGRHDLLMVDPETGRIARAWVREQPAPPLPEIPYTVIRVMWADPEDDSNDVFALQRTLWVSADCSIDAVQLRLTITNFEVLSEPRAVTAKAVLGRLLSRFEAEGMPFGANGVEAIELTGRDFGVES
jgi:hypothetical protein